MKLETVRCTHKKTLGTSGYQVSNFKFQLHRRITCYPIINFQQG
ncbi:Uncharacterized protein dnm_099410 [Desulfonema magnum]|uniref:Uncharacterized protein n=1 Tax=Desulfonema magnum TaxID=45655 RepID=A0A975BY31_9BACT|nr:Uncharacterized protein dnm_099410 [Desulfonema magnum]